MLKRSLKAGEFAKRFGGGLAVGVVRQFWRFEQAKLSGFTLDPDRGSPSVRCVFGYTLESAFIGYSYFGIPRVLCSSTNAKIRFPVVQRIAIDVINDSRITRLEAKNEAVHAYLLLPVFTYPDSSVSVSPKLSVVPDSPTKSRYLVVIVGVDDGHHSIGERYRAKRFCRHA